MGVWMARLHWGRARHVSRVGRWQSPVGELGIPVTIRARGSPIEGVYTSNWEVQCGPLGAYTVHIIVRRFTARPHYSPTNARLSTLYFANPLTPHPGPLTINIAKQPEPPPRRSILDRDTDTVWQGILKQIQRDEEVAPNKRQDHMDNIFASTSTPKPAPMPDPDTYGFASVLGGRRTDIFSGTDGTDHTYTPVEYGNAIIVNNAALLEDFFRRGVKQRSWRTRFRIWWDAHRPHLHFGYCDSETY